MNERGLPATRKDGAPGIDGVTADAYATNLDANLWDLLGRIKSGRYKALHARGAPGNGFSVPDFRGDPSSALLEVLDPEQDHTFSDHYLEVDYDLSNVMFITTANTLNVPPPLMDRMEIICIAGYTEDEKVEIARKHLIPYAITKHGLDTKEWAIDDEADHHPPLHARGGRAQPRARARDLDPQCGQRTDHVEEEIG